MIDLKAAGKNRVYKFKQPLCINIMDTKNTTDVILPENKYTLWKFPIVKTKTEEIYFVFVDVTILVAAIATVLTNLLVQYTFTAKLKHYKKSSDVLVIFLGASDVLTGIFALPTLAIMMILWSSGKPSSDLVEYIRSMGIIFNWFCLTDTQIVENTAKLSRSVLITFRVCYAIPMALAFVMMVFNYNHFVDTYIRLSVFIVHYVNTLLDPILYCL